GPLNSLPNSSFRNAVSRPSTQIGSPAMVRPSPRNLRHRPLCRGEACLALFFLRRNRGRHNCRRDAKIQMMLGQLWIFASSLALLGAAPASAPSSAPTPEQILAQRKEAERKDQEQKVAGLPLLPAHQIKDLFQITIDNNELIIRPKLGRTDLSRVKIDGMQG